MKRLLLLSSLFLLGSYQLLAQPAAPTSLAATTAGMFQINLSWQQSTSIKNFEVERSTDGKNFALVSSPTTNSVSDKGVVDKVRYFYRVRAIDAKGAASAYSNTADATTFTAPAAPSNLTATAASASQINLAWQDNSIDERSNRVERSTDGTNFTEIANLGPNINTFQNMGLASNTKFFYRVRAVFDDIDRGSPASPYSNNTNATTLAAAPSTPKTMTVTVISASQIDISWEDTANNETGFELERSTDNANFTKITTTGTNVVTFQDKSFSGVRFNSVIVQQQYLLADRKT